MSGLSHAHIGDQHSSATCSEITCFVSTAVAGIVDAGLIVAIPFEPGSTTTGYSERARKYAHSQITRKIRLYVAISRVRIDFEGIKQISSCV